MKLHDRVVAVSLVVALAGCSDSSPTSPRLEQAVFTALGGLRVGEALTVSGPEAAEISVGGAGTVGEFVYIPFHDSDAYGAELQLSVRGEGVTPLSARPQITSPPAVALRLDSHRLPSSEMHERLHARLQNAAEAARPRFRGLLRTRLTPRDDLRGSSATVGELVQINTSTAPGACTAVDLRTGRVEAITQRAIVVGDVNNPGGGFTRADYESFGQEFDTLVHPTITRYFDNPTDIDENGKVIIFVTRAVNELTGPNEDGFIGGFFYARDLFPRAGGCPASNEGEIFFVLAPDPLAEASPLVHTRDDVFDDAVGTIGHEYEHLINSGRRLYVNDAEFEDSWLDEGLAHIAEEVLFYQTTGLTPRSNITVESVVTSQERIDDFFRFGVQNLARYASYLRKVPAESPTGPDNLETRGAAWSFLRYVADHTERADEELFKSLVNSTTTGIDNVEAVLGEDATEWFRRWGVSVYTDDLIPIDSPALLMQPSWNFRNLLPALFPNFPLKVETLGSGATVDYRVKAMSSAYLRFSTQESASSTLFLTSGGAAPPEGAHVTVVRIR